MSRGKPHAGFWRDEPRSSLLRGVLLGLAILPVAGMAADTTTVVQQHRAFSTDRLTEPMGTILHFSNQDDFAHEIYVQSASFNFESDEQEPGEILSLPLTARGHFTIHCHIHPKMHLDVDVQ